MKTNDLEIPLLTIASVFTLEFLNSWLGVGVAFGLLVFTIIRIIQALRNWNQGKNEERRAKEKRIEEHEQHELKMKLLQKELEEKERKKH